MLEILLLRSRFELLDRGGQFRIDPAAFAFSFVVDAVVDDFLANHPEFVELDCQALLAQQDITVACGRRLRLSPHLHGTDGFFAAVLERVR